MILRRILLLLMFVVFQSQHANLNAACDGCRRGDCLSELTGAFVTNHLYNSNISGITLTIGPGFAIPFNQTPVTGGNAITQTSLTTFSITKPGHYLVNFVAPTALVTLLGGVNLNLNGIPQGVVFPLALAGVPLVLQQVINVTSVPSTLEVVINSLIGLSVTLLGGTSSTISIVQLSSP